MAILSKAPEGAKVLDLGAARSARAEVRAAEGQGNPVIKLAAGYVEVRPEISISIASAFENNDIRGGLAGLLVDPADVDALFDDGLTAQDMEAVSYTHLRAHETG
jgi:hypothetical protein